MKLYNQELELFINFLFKLKLIDQKSRMRSRLVSILTDKFKQFKDEHIQLLKEHSHLDAQGNPVVIEKNGQSQYDVIDLVDFNKAYDELLNEEVHIEQNNERKNMLLSVQDSILNCGLEFEGAAAYEYDRWCTVVEEINYPETQPIIGD